MHLTRAFSLDKLASWGNSTHVQEFDAIPVSDPFGEGERDLLMAVRELVSADREMRRTLSRRMAMGERDLRAVRFVMAATREGRAATPNELAAHLGISTAATTVLLDRLMVAGHVERRPHPTDGRRKIVVPTPRAYAETRTELVGGHDRMRAAAAAVPMTARPAVLTFLGTLAEVMRDEASPR